MMVRGCTRTPPSWGHTSAVPSEDRRWARSPMGWTLGWGHLGFKMQTQLTLAKGRE